MHYSSKQSILYLANLLDITITIPFNPRRLPFHSLFVNQNDFINLQKRAFIQRHLISIVAMTTESPVKHLALNRVKEIGVEKSSKYICS